MFGLLHRRPCQETFGGGDKFGKVAFDGRGHDAVGGVEVAMTELVAHAGHVPPRDVGLMIQHLRVDVLDRLADLDESYSYGVEDQPVRKFSARQVSLDRSSGREHIPESLPV